MPQIFAQPEQTMTDAIAGRGEASFGSSAQREGRFRNKTVV